MSRPMSRSQRAMVAIFFPAILVIILVVGRGLGYDDSEDGGSVATVDLSSASDETEFEHDFVIPAGTGDRIAAGEVVDIVPGELTVHVGDALRIVNNDDEGHQVGVFYVGAGETLTQRFNSPGTLSDECDVHSSGAFTLIVLPAA